MLKQTCIVSLMSVFLFSALTYLYSEQYKCVYDDWLRGEQCEDNVSQGQCSYLEGKYTPGKCSAKVNKPEGNTKKYTRAQTACLEQCYPRCTLLYEYERQQCNQSCKAQCGVYD
jgi:hypothetical protein